MDLWRLAVTALVETGIRGFVCSDWLIISCGPRNRVSKSVRTASWTYFVTMNVQYERVLCLF